MAMPIDDLLPTFDESGHHTKRVRSWDEEVVSQLTRAETRAQVRECIDKLAAPYRTVLLLRDIEGLNTDETADQLGVTPGTVKTRLHRARMALRTLLGPLVLSD
jgi:RNA polymerase sigma-70 factor (ECF subfamily)